MTTPLDDPALRTIMQAFEAEGEAIRLIGGAVRNMLMGLPLSDHDLATTALPLKILDIAGKHHWRAIPTGIEHGTVTILLDGKTFEITTLREDVETHGRHATVKFGHDFRTDALRRDFTINALSLSLDGTIHDYTQGRADIARRRVRFIGKARERIAEDYLRILRFFRFSARYADGFDAEALHAIIKARTGLLTLSKERILTELLKILEAPRAASAARLMTDMNILPLILGGIGNPLRLDRLVQLDQLAGQNSDAVLRLAALALFCPDDALRLREYLRLSNEQTHRLSKMAAIGAALHSAQTPPSKSALREGLFVHGRTSWHDALTLAFCASRAAPDDPQWQSALRFVRDTPLPQLPFTGADLVARGLAPGPSVGATLKTLQALWIRAGFPREPHELARLLDQAIGQKHP